MSELIKRIEQNYEKEWEAKEAKRWSAIFQELNEKIDKIESNGELIAAEFKDVNEIFGRLFDLVYRGNLGVRSFIEHSNDKKKTALEEFMYFEYPSGVTGLNKFSKLLAKSDISNESETTKEGFKYAVAATNELIEIREKLVEFKQLIVKKRKSVVEAEKEVARRGSHEDVKKAVKYLTGLIESNKTGIIDHSMRVYQKYYHNIVTALKEDNLVISPNSKDTNYKQNDYSISEILKVANFKYGDKYMVMKDQKEIDHQIEKDALRNYEDLKMFYVSRVSDKVAVILSDKGNLEKIETLNLHVNHEVEALLTFKFNDKSQFDLSTKVEWVNGYTQNPQQFMRVPTRFHNVVTPDGVRHTANLSQKGTQDLYAMEYNVVNDNAVEDYLRKKVDGVEYSTKPSSSKRKI